MLRLGLSGLSETEKKLVRSALQLLASRVSTPQWELTEHPPCDVLLTVSGTSSGFELQQLHKMGQISSEIGQTVRLDKPLRIAPLLEVLQKTEARLSKNTQPANYSKRIFDKIGMAAARGWGDIVWHSMSGSVAKSLYVEKKPRVILLPQDREIHFKGSGADLALLLKTSVPQLSRENAHPSTLLFGNRYHHDWLKVFWGFGAATPSQYHLPGVNHGTVIRLEQSRDFSHLPHYSEYRLALELLAREAMTIGRLQSTVNMPIMKFMPMVTALLLSGAAQVQPAVAETEQVFTKPHSFFKRLRKQLRKNAPASTLSSRWTI